MSEMTENDDVPGPSLAKDIEFIKGPKNKNILVRGHRRHFHHHTLKKDGSQVWKCTSNKFCKAKIKVLDGRIIDEDTHTCSLPTKTSPIKEVFKQECLQIIQNQHTPITMAYKEVKRKFMDTGFYLVEDLPSFQSLKSSLYRYRDASFKMSNETPNVNDNNETFTLVKNPNSMDETEIDIQISTTPAPAPSNELKQEPLESELRKQVDHLTYSLNKKKKVVKRLQDKNRAQNIQIEKLQGKLRIVTDKLKHLVDIILTDE